MTDRDFVRLTVRYSRLTDTDRDGTVEIVSDGAEVWDYACIGSHHGMQGESDGTDERVMGFAAEMAALVRKHYGAIPPMLPSTPAPQDAAQEGEG